MAEEPFTDIEAVTLTALCGLALATGRRLVEPADLQGACVAAGLAQPAWFESLLALRDRGLAQVAAGSDQVVLVAATGAGILAYLDGSRPDLDDLKEKVWAAAVAAPAGQAVALHEQVGEPALLVEALLDLWVTERRLVYSRAVGGRFRIHRARE